MDIQVTKLPKLTHENIEQIMEERMAATKTDLTSIPILWQGFLDEDVLVGDQTRSVKMYIPKDTRQTSHFVLMNTPEGKNAISFLRNSGWVNCADRYGICLCAAEAGAGGWKSPEEEFPYFIKCMLMLIEGVHFRTGMSIYAVGYGPVGNAMHRLAVENPLKIAAAAFVDASNLEERYLRDTEEKSLDRNGWEFGASIKDIPVPVMILEKKLSAKARNAAAHWAKAIGVNLTEADITNGAQFVQRKQTVCETDGNCAEVRVQEYSADGCDVEITETIAGFLAGYARYGKVSPIGNALVKVADYDKIGAETLYFIDPNGNRRECLVYVPKAFRNQGKLPMVFALHGACESIRGYFEESLWQRKADKEGIIVVMPEAFLQPVPGPISMGYVKAYRSIWNIWKHDDQAFMDSELHYFNQILDHIIAQYPVDVSRMYCMGHSMGNMMTNFVGSSWLGHRFAALAASSGIMDVWHESGTEKIPFWMNLAQYDLWDHDVRKGPELTRTLDHWLIRDGLATEETVEQVRLSGAQETYTEGRYHGMVWKNKDGIPMLCYEWIGGKDHMAAPMDTERFWDRWFSKWTLDAEKGRCYEGKLYQRR